MARLRLALTARREGVIDVSRAKITIRNLVALGNESSSMAERRVRKTATKSGIDM